MPEQPPASASPAAPRDLATPTPAATPLARARAGLDACVHCGFCLQACPTYLTLEDENDSPRGRLLLMRALLDGTLGADDADLRTHIDRCLGCRGCETACPSGVPYGELLEATRATLAIDRPIPLLGRMVLWVVAHPRRIAAACAMARAVRASRLAALLALLPGRLGFAMAMLASTAPRRGRLARATRAPVAGAPSTGAPSIGVPSADVPSAPTAPTAVLRGCVMHGVFRETNRATERLLVRVGARLVEVRDQVCCGALHAHAGDLEGARALARANVAAFSAALTAAAPQAAAGTGAGGGAPVIVTNSAGCGAMLKSYGHLLSDDPVWAERAAAVAAAARDISEVVAPAIAAGLGPGRAAAVPARHARHEGASRRPRVAYDPPCHLLHAQRVDDPPRAMLSALPGIEIVSIPDADQCCGAAGIYNLLQPQVSESVLALKLAAIAASGATVVATGNPGCLMQIGAGLRRAGSAIGVVHPVDLVDAAWGD